MGVRDTARGDAARDAILRDLPHASVRVARVDLSDLDSVRALAAEDLDVDGLVNNAGVAFVPKVLTREGVVSQFATNHLGHFALTALLFDRLARVVTVTSTLAKKGRLDLDNLDGSRGYGSMRAYAQSKLANVLFASELARRLKARGSPVKSVLVHPGVPATAMQERGIGLAGVVARIASALIGKPAVHGARAVLAATIGDDVDNGDLFEPGDPPKKKAAPWPTMLDERQAAALWERSEALTKLRFL